MYFSIVCSFLGFRNLAGWNTFVNIFDIEKHFKENEIPIKAVKPTFVKTENNSYSSNNTQSSLRFYEC